MRARCSRFQVMNVVLRLVLQRVEDVHGAVLDAVLVAGDQAAADAAVVGVLAGVVEQVRVAVQPLVMIPIEMAARPSVLEISGERFRVRLTNSARRSA
jgi:hypothetical protein